MYVVPYAETCKNLGVYISVDLSWNTDISKIISKVNPAL